MPKKFKLFTEAPLKTLGDIMAAKKLLTLFQNEEDIEFEWVIIREEPLEDKAITTVPNVQLKVTNVKAWKDIDISSYHDADIFMVYPHIPFSDENPNKVTLCQEFKNFLAKLPQDKIVLSCTEYNTIDLDLHRAIRQYYPLVQRLDTGFKELGVFMDKQKTPEELLAQFQECEEKLSKALFESLSEKEYFENHHLYFGYLNTSVSTESGLNAIDSQSYILNCIKDGLQNQKEHKKNIDIFVPIDEDCDFKHLFGSLLTKEERAKLGNITWISPNETENIATGEGINLRIFSVPLKHPAMLYLIAQSNPLAMGTGDQSFAEELSYNKLCLYQIMDWKENAFAKYLEEVQTFCEQKLQNKDAALYRFYQLQSQLVQRNKSWTRPLLALKRERILKFYHEEKSTLLVQQKMFGDYLKEKCNLNDTFIPAIKNVMNLHPLLKASAIGDEKSVNRMVSEVKLSEKKIDDIRDSSGNSSLLLAMLKQHISCMELLIQAGANVDVVNKDGEHAVGFAIDNENNEALELLLRNNVSLEIPYEDKTVLNYAETKFECSYVSKIVRVILFHHSNRQLLKLLNNKSADEYFESNKEDSLSLLDTAARADRLDVVSAILKQADFNGSEALKTCLLALISATKMGHEHVVQALLDSDKINFADIATFELVLVIAKSVEYRHLNITKLLCKKFPELEKTAAYLTEQLKAREEPVNIAKSTNSFFHHDEQKKEIASSSLTCS